MKKLLVPLTLLSSTVFAEVQPTTVTYELDKGVSVSFTSAFQETNKKGEMKVTKNGKEIQKLSVNLFAPAFDLHAIDNGKFSSGTKAFGLTESYEACAYPAGEGLFLWDGTKVVQGPDVFVSNDDGAIATMSYVLKWQPNCLRVDSVLTPDMEVEENKGRKPSTTSEFYAWDGKTLQKSKACPK